MGAVLAWMALSSPPSPAVPPLAQAIAVALLASSLLVLAGTRGTHLDIASEENEPLLEAALPSPTPEDLLLDREMEGLLAEALGELREERRSALLLRIDHGLAYEDIAQVMGWSLPKVKNEIHRARLQLRERLAGHVGNGGHS